MQQASIIRDQLCTTGKTWQRTQYDATLCFEDLVTVILPRTSHVAIPFLEYFTQKLHTRFPRVVIDMFRATGSSREHDP